MTTETLLSCKLRDMFFYNPVSGRLYWNVPIQGRKIGSSVGSFDGNGRIRVEIAGKTYSASHIIWAMHYDKWPENQIDHINLDRSDNRLSNLREATNAQNSCNRKSKNKLGVKGVTLRKGKYIARIRENGKTHHLGTFTELADAKTAYQSAALELHGEFACPSN